MSAPCRTCAAPTLPGISLGLLLLRPSAAPEPRFSNVFQSSMVLQRQRPIEVWGFGALDGETLDVTLDCPGGKAVSWTEATATKLGHWSATLSTPPDSFTGVPLRLNLTRRGGRSPEQSLDDVVLGDVYLFSGQSNVDLPVTYVHQFSAEDMEEEERFADKVGRSGSLRLMIVPARCGLTYHDSYEAPELADVGECLPCPPAFGPKTAINSCNLLGGHAGKFTYCNCDSLRWTRPSGPNIRGFSAVAWFTGKALLSVEAVRGVPIGLVRSSWGATNIAVWSGPDALAKCPQEGEPPMSFAPYVKSALFAHMVFPLKGLQFSAAVWVHGARNIGGPTPYMGGKYYSCALRAMISDWRQKLEQELPFLVVESPVYCNELDYKTWHTWCDDRTSQLTKPDHHLPEMRLAQNQAEALPEVYLVSTMDEGSLKKAMGGAIHSEKKEQLGRRLALAARAAVYKDREVVWSGPTVVMAWRSGESQVSLCFDTQRGGALHLDLEEQCPSSVLPVYCTGATFELQTNGFWGPPLSVSLCGQRIVLEVPGGCIVDRVRYAWADWPVNCLRSVAGMPARLFDIEVRGENETGAACPRIPEEEGSEKLCTVTTATRTTTTTSATTTTTTTTTVLGAAAAFAPPEDAGEGPSTLQVVVLSLLLLLTIPLLVATWWFFGRGSTQSSCLLPVSEARNEPELAEKPLEDPPESSVTEPASSSLTTMSEQTPSTSDQGKHAKPLGRMEMARLMALAAAPGSKGKSKQRADSEATPLMG